MLSASSKLTCDHFTTKGAGEQIGSLFQDFGPGAKLGTCFKRGLSLRKGCLHALAPFQAVQHRLAQVAVGDDVEAMVHWCRLFNRCQAGVVGLISDLVYEVLADLV